MAERRMFAKSIINSARFLMMPVSSRLLYYDLGMAADDEGVVEAYMVMKMTGAGEDDLRVLVSKGFLRILNEECVAYITDWKRNNQIRGDRFQESCYHDLLVKMVDGNQMETDGLPDGNQMTTTWQPNDNQMETQYSIGKDRLGKDSVDNTPKPQKGAPEGVVREIIQYLNKATGKQYKVQVPKTQKLISARISEGFGVDDFKVVIDRKCQEWGGTDMEKYLRPETLFGTKFEGYLNQPDKMASADGWDYIQAVAEGRAE